MTRVAIVAAAPGMRRRLETIARASESLRVSAVAVSVEALAAEPGLAASDVVLLHATTGFGARELDGMPPIPVVALVDGRVTAAETSAMLAAGVRGVLPCDATGEEIGAAADAVAAGLVVVPPEVVSVLVASRSAPSDARRDAAVVARAAAGGAAPALTPRERDVLSMLAEGLPNKLIASRLGISGHTVKTHLEAIFEKLGASTRAEAVARGVTRGLLLL